MSELKKISPCMYLLEKEDNMKVPGLIVASESLLTEIEIERPLEQVKNVATLEGIVGYSIAMPDIHWGYGFAIGAVAAMDVETGVISPGGVGYDINCGVRFAKVPLKFKEMKTKDKELLLKIVYQKVPSGLGSEQKKTKALSLEDYKKIAKMGAFWSLENGFGLKEDILNTENRGVIEGADIKEVSMKAMERGKNQIGSVGSGNHFIEIGEIQNIKDTEIAKIWEIEEGDVYILIHSGSRGFGHQICQDTLSEFIKKGYANELVDKQLVSAPIKSIDGKNYIKRMAAAANFAFNNRQQILHFVRDSFFEVFNIEKENIVQLYDVCHNIAKFEAHEVDGKKRDLCVHRKGATRALGPNSKELTKKYQRTGQPVLVPGDMGRASYLLSGLGNEKVFSSCCHGAGRAKSRVQSSKEWRGVDLIAHMKKMGTDVMAKSKRTISEEMPDAYKPVDEVVETVEIAKLAKIVAKLKPHLVVKG